MKKFLLIFCALLTGLIFMACDTSGPYSPGEPALGAAPGDLTITINDGISRSIIPDLNMSPAYYLVEGSRSGGHSFSERTEGTLIVENIAPGEWEVTATAYNDTDIPIGSEVVLTNVISEEVTEVSITVSPYNGTGTLDLTVNWPAGQIADPQIQADLVPNDGGSSRVLVFNIIGNQATFIASDIPAGNYSLSIKLLDNTSIAATEVDVVYIAQGATSSGSFTFNNLNHNTGEVDIEITPKMNDPLDVFISGASATKPENDNMTLLTGVSNNHEDIAFTWYVNGDAVESGEKFILDKSWEKGFYSIVVTAFSMDESRAGSASVLVQITDACFIPFISVWDMSQTATKTLNFPLADDGDYDFTIDWGDGTIESYTDYNVSHTYSLAGTYEVTVTGLCDGFGFSTSDPENNEENFIDVSQWGSVRLNNEGYRFAHCTNLQGFSALDAPDLSNTTQFGGMFYGAESFSYGLANWDTSNITDMICMFWEAKVYNEDISNWDTSSLTRTRYMFYEADLFNQDISGWDTSKIDDMGSMFEKADLFNQDLSDWDTSNVTSLRATFSGALSFNQDISTWDTSKVTDMSYLFREAEAFNQDLSGWDTSSVSNMTQLFCEAGEFNQNISGWDTSEVETMDYMFYIADSFNQDLSNWDTSKVQNMQYMFSYAQSFTNGGNAAGLENWDVSNVMLKTSMFSACPLSPQPSWY